MKRLLRWGKSPLTAVTPHANNSRPNPTVIWRPTGGLARAVSAIVITPTAIQVTFNRCVVISSTLGIQTSVNGGGWITVFSFTQISDTVYTFTVEAAIEPGDVVRWRYTGGVDSIVDCEESEDIGSQELPVQNPLQLTGNFVLLSVGGKDIVLLTDDTDETSGVQTSDA